MKTIELIIDTDGTPSADAKGFTGGECKHALDKVLKPFAGAERTGTDKPEIHIPAPKTKGSLDQRA